MAEKDWTGNGDSIFKTLGASNHTEKERETDDFYATDPRAIDILLDYLHLQVPHGVWEPSCGSGCLSKRLEERGHYVVSTDLVDRGFGSGGVNFFDQKQMPFGCAASENVQLQDTNLPAQFAIGLKNSSLMAMLQVAAKTENVVISLADASRAILIRPEDCKDSTTALCMPMLLNQ